MKKILKSIVVIFAVLVGIGACVDTLSDEPSVSDSAGSNSNDNSTEQKTTFGINETITMETLELTALEVKTSTGSGYAEPAEGNIYVGVRLEIKNISDETEAVSSLLMFSAYANDTKVEQSFFTGSEFTDGTIEGDLSSGKKMSGWIVYEVPKDSSVLELEFSPEVFKDEKYTINLDIV